MGQAKTLNARELKRVLDFISAHRYAARNRAIVLTAYYGCLRVGEVAKLRYGDVVATDGSIKAEFHLTREQTKGGHARTVFVNQKLRKELAAYIKALGHRQPDQALFWTQKRKQFSPNTLCQWFWWMYRRAGIDGASSHSGRRSMLSDLASKGVGVRVLMQIAGHRQLSSTQVYLDVRDDMMRRAVELV